MRRKNFVKRIDGGRIYFSYMPNTLAFEHFSSQVIEQFRSFDAMISGTSLPVDVDPGATFEKIGSELGYSGDATNGDSRTFSSAVAFLSRSPKISESALVLTNNAFSKNSSGYRKGDVWIGASDPWDAWYVGPPSCHIHDLMRNLIGLLANRKLPATARSIIGYVQLLLIHPFVDGNGRSARALFVSLLIRELGLTHVPAAILADLSRFRNMALQGAMQEVVANDNWDECFAIYGNALRKVMGRESREVLDHQ